MRSFFCLIFMTTSSNLLDSFRHNRTRGTNDDINLTLRPAYRALLAELGNPHLKLPPVIHVAGTNGKGSTCAFLRAMLEAAGKKVHVYTSPHLVRFHERIRVAGQLIEEDELVELLQACQKLSAPNSITYFEAATAAAFTAFAQHAADYTILEVGLGGRLDATNIIPHSVASIITRLSFDHRDYLGDTLQAIAHEKAGIMRAGVPCFVAAQPAPEALRAVREASAAIGAPLFVAGQDWQVQKHANGFRFSDGWHALDLPMPALPGDHQYDNAGLAIAALLGVQGSGVGGREIAGGLRNVEWQARLQKINDGFLARMLPPDFELWLDGGHNDSAGDILARQTEQWKAQDAKELHLVCGMLTTKAPAEFLGPLRDFARGLQAVPVPDEATFSAEAFAQVARDAGIRNVFPAENVQEALQRIVRTHSKPVRILICGSLYLAGDVLRLNSDNKDLKIGK